MRGTLSLWLHMYDVQHVWICSVIHTQRLHGCLALVKWNGMEHWNGILKWPKFSKLHLKFSQVNMGTLSTCLPIKHFHTTL